MKRSGFLFIVIVVMAGTLLARCGGSDKKEVTTPPPAESATTANASATAIGTSSPGALSPTAAQASPTSGAATPNQATPAAPPTRPNLAPTPTLTPVVRAGATPPAKPAGAGPLVLWMIAERGGTGAITVHFETDVETTATLTAVAAAGSPSNPADPPLTPVEIKEFRTRHTDALAIGQRTVLFIVDTVDREGRHGIGSLEVGPQVIAGQFWGPPNAVAKVEHATGRKATVSWTNLRPTQGVTGFGYVQLFSRPAGCSTAQACAPEAAGTFTDDTVGGDQAFENHAIALAFPAGNLDFRALITAPRSYLEAGRTDSRFRQMNILAADVK